jgi:bifunctional ADP-heptose synthase (sugar kinase/adenylyltransferase)
MTEIITKLIVDCTTGEQTIVPLTDEELVEQIEFWNPKYFVIGTDYFGKNIIGRDKAQNLIFFEKISGYSTTKIIDQCTKY